LRTSPHIVDFALCAAGVTIRGGRHAAGRGRGRIGLAVLGLERRQVEQDRGVRLLGRRARARGRGAPGSIAPPRGRRLLLAARPAAGNGLAHARVALVRRAPTELDLGHPEALDAEPDPRGERGHEQQAEPRAAPAHDPAKALSWP
jgi:hypothetical protein